MISYPFQRERRRHPRARASGTAGAPVVLVHGTGGRADRWVRNIDAVASSGLHVYAVDLPGHGFASKGEGIDLLRAGVLPGSSPNSWTRCRSRKGDDRRHVTRRSCRRALSRSITPEARRWTSCSSAAWGWSRIGDEARARVQAGANNQSREGVATKFPPASSTTRRCVTPEMEEEEFPRQQQARAPRSRSRSSAATSPSGSTRRGRRTLASPPTTDAAASGAPRTRPCRRRSARRRRRCSPGRARGARRRRAHVLLRAARRLQPRRCGLPQAPA